LKQPLVKDRNWPDPGGTQPPALGLLQVTAFGCVNSKQKC